MIHVSRTYATDPQHSPVGLLAVSKITNDVSSTVMH